MTRIHDDPASFRDDWLAGYTAAYSRYVELVPNDSSAVGAVWRRTSAGAGGVEVLYGGLRAARPAV